LKAAIEKKGGRRGEGLIIVNRKLGREVGVQNVASCTLQHALEQKFNLKK
jgi:hypothetical protein